MNEHEAHVTPPRTYATIFAALIALTATTWGLAYVEVGPLHVFVGIGIAVIKALLIILFFMHVLHSRGLTWVVALGGAFWLGILIIGTLNDFLTRTWSLYTP
jgi:cytochrome c oxidase subunit IV